MKHQDTDELDGVLRQYYEPDVEVVRRVAANALSGQPGRRAWGRTTVLLAFAAISLALLVLFRQLSPVQPETARLDYVGGVAVLQYPDGSSWLMTLESADETAPDGLNLILVGGRQ